MHAPCALHNHMDKPVIVTDASFENDVLKSQTPVLVDFWAEWCGPCHMVAPTLVELAREHADKLTIAKVNVDENPQIAGRYGIMSIPTLALFVDGDEKKRLIGAQPKQSILSQVQPFLA